MACADAAESIRPYKILGWFHPKPCPFVLSRWISLLKKKIWSADDVICRIIHSSLVRNLTHTKPAWKEKSINVRKCSADHHESRKNKKNLGNATASRFQEMLDVRTHTCYILFLATPERNTWRKTHTFHQAYTSSSSVIHGEPALFCLLFSLFLSLIRPYRSRNVSSLSRPNLIPICI